ncbi:TPA: FAD-dependent oxidoreductase [Bacillus cereus]|uniref:phytoene desaturase family protein n=1 Tax=Bacillus TaxID=1386 RepID=UPI001C2F9B0A|nr:MULTISPECIES: FAD-dependent oxidoreductase [unclassified Bacillus (in: firmicutes)]MCQ6349364.1 FAD-dependent oxidoreductase [Bacillus cereus]MCP1180672.1 FAD-dependent oxidoreductase [Bacillus sp. 1663tsa1]MCP1284339.1 FAD-dependent oxidoreductase [Bacillus sp. S0635]MCU5750760.1 FAD-dependent oxidoreductase [Bacillus cereus]MDA1633877.1 FAD-dependent oxidoreductase [Bacillus cereus]
MNTFDVAIVGGGLAGLTASIYLAKAGRKVIVLEKSSRFGGRGMTVNKNGVCMNLGAHALYRGGAAFLTFNELGLNLPGGMPSTKAHGIWKGDVFTIPTDFRSILATPLLSWAAKVQFSRLMIHLGNLNVGEVPKMSLTTWAEKEIKDPMVRNIFYALCRTTTYTFAPTMQLASSVLKQIQLSMKEGVFYVDGGWETIIKKLRDIANNLGVQFSANKHVLEIEHYEDKQRIHCFDDELFEVGTVIVTTPPKEACKIIKGAEGTSLYRWSEQSVPVTVAALDIGLRRLTNPTHQFALGLDQPIFFTNQSRAAKLSKDGAIAVSLIKYHNPVLKMNHIHEDKEQLESMMELLHPNWKREVVAQQYLPKITVVHDFPHIDRVEKPGPNIPEMPGVCVAGDWAGHDEILADAAVASGKRAALHILKQYESEAIHHGNGAII